MSWKPRTFRALLGASTGCRRIPKDHLIEPAPARGRRVPCSVFLRTHWKAIAASDFFTARPRRTGWEDSGRKGDFR
jgi:hypothetical protein